jgi:hypothetical protein
MIQTYLATDAKINIPYSTHTNGNDEFKKHKKFNVTLFVAKF